jgi:hypothetical protein
MPGFGLLSTHDGGLAARFKPAVAVSTSRAQIIQGWSKEMVREVRPRIRRRRTLRRVGSVAATVVAMVVGVGVVPASAVGTDPNDPPPNPCISNSSASVSVSPSSVSLGQSTTVSWSLTKPANCPALTGHLSFEDPASGRRFAVDGSVVTPQASGQYVLLVNLPGAVYVMASASVTVGLPMVNGHPLASITRGGDQVELFGQGVSTPNAVVTINSDVDLDLSGQSPLVVAPGVQIIGQRNAAHPSGPRLFTTTHQSPMLTVGSYPHPSDNVRITGIRLDGGESSNPCDETGVPRFDANGVPYPDVNGIDVSASQHVELDHNELYHFNGSAVEVYDPGQTVVVDPKTGAVQVSGRIDSGNPDTVTVHDNYIHDNQHPTKCVDSADTTGHGAGYGVSIKWGAYATVEHNVFSNNRHAISAMGSYGDGYILRGNLILSPGIETIGHFSDTYSQSIDVHGQYTYPGTVDHPCASTNTHLSSSYNCGPAGESFSVDSNTVAGLDGFTGDPNGGIQLRGTPTSFVAPATGGMQVTGNVFVARSVDALTQTVAGLVDAGQNTFGADLQSFFDTASNAPCDFDGDLHNDPFRASGASWWYYSSRVHHWVALDTTTATTATFSDVNHDGFCDATNGTTRLTKPFLETFPALATTVPNLIGSTQNAATTTLTSVGLTLGAVTTAASLAPVGTIIATSLAAGTAAQIGSAASIIVSSGGVAVPSLIGIPEDWAVNAIQTAGLVWQGSSTGYSDVRAHQVTWQIPAAGTVVAPGTGVRLSVSLGPEPGTNPDPGGGGPSCFKTCK